MYVRVIRMASYPDGKECRPILYMLSAQNAKIQSRSRSIDVLIILLRQSRLLND